MSAPIPRCENCGAELPSVSAICAHCEKEFSSSQPDAPPGKHICPKCNLRFNAPIFVWWPMGAPWYVPQVQRIQCPHCKCLLRDRKSASYSGKERIAFVGAWVLATLIPSRVGYLKWLMVIPVIALFIFTIRRIEWFVSDENRYACGDDA